MIQTVLVAIPGILALIVCLRWGPERALLNVYLPVLLFLPEYPGRSRDSFRLPISLSCR